MDAPSTISEQNYNYASSSAIDLCVAFDCCFGCNLPPSIAEYLLRPAVTLPLYEGVGIYY